MKELYSFINAILNILMAVFLAGFGILAVLDIYEPPTRFVPFAACFAMAFWSLQFAKEECLKLVKRP